MTQALPIEIPTNGTPLDDRLWRALQARDPSADGVYAVRSTGIYCRFGCPSRPPRRENALHFDGPGSAVAAGYRACRRCGTDPSGHTVLGMCRYIESQAGRIPSLAELAERFDLSPSHLQRVFKARVGVSPRAYADALRVDALRGRLRNGEPVLQAMIETGYGSASRLYESAGRTLGMTPRAYRDKAAGEAITYATVRCPLGGALLVAATARGVCAVRMGARTRDLVAELRDEFAAATLRPGDDTFTEPLVAFLRGLGPLPELPLDVRATAFQRRVWEAIRAVPHGETATYSDIAQAIGAPRSVRAVARACGQNPVALVIPCHRVVPKTGGGGGYRWGMERKRQLLALERGGGSAPASRVTSARRRSPR